MTNSLLTRFVECLMPEGIASLSQAPPDFAVESCIQALQGRFASRSLQIAMDSSQKISVRWLPAAGCNPGRSAYCRANANHAGRPARRPAKLTGRHKP